VADRIPERRAREAPRSTYRLQLTADLDLFEAARRVPYLHDLGVDWVYLSPILAAQPGSTHGYDVVAHDAVDESRGGAAGLAALSAAAHDLGMGVLVDIVPNHIGVDEPVQSHWWRSVLEQGQDSPYAAYFDVDWDHGGGALVLPSADNQGDLNYRRFFTISTLAAVRVEDPEVFEAVHAEVRRWFDEGLVDGLRIDHPDGLRDPEKYLRDLAELTGGAYVVVEKILVLRDGPDESSSGPAFEELDPDWSCEGTTGYDALAAIDRVLTDPDGARALAAAPGSDSDFDDLVHDRKLDVARGTLLPETRRIARELVSTPLDPRVSTPLDPQDTLDHRWSSEVETTLEQAVAELLACFPVYRSYLAPGHSFGVEHLEHALAEARRRRPDLASTYDGLDPLLHDPAHPAALRLQQTSGMVMAKGVEDNAFYRWARLTSLNEVGGEPSVSSLDPAHFHGWAARRLHEWPDAMTSLTTHDTKRSEDTRARITALAEVPSEWVATLEQLQHLAPMPDAGLANLLWQAAVGAWPLSRERLHAYAEKAMREAGEHTDWLSPDEEFERSVHESLDAAYDDVNVARAVQEMVDRVEPAGRSNALAARLVAITMPGVPDVYQGTELGDFSLVDPDNRRPVDFDRAARLLAEGTHAKQRLTAEALRLRRDRPDLFTTYEPVIAEGPAAEHVMAFDRGGVVTVVTRLPIGLATQGGWRDTVVRLPDGAARVADVLADRPAEIVVRR
jgi:(1->4)-alpha-D-glucan 1-alpha-D-glucosylmutase